MLQPIGPIAVLGSEPDLRGWFLSITPHIHAAYAALEVRKPVEHAFQEQTPGLVLYIPDSGITHVKSRHSDERFRIAPGMAYLYSSESGPHEVSLQVTGSYSGLKVFFNTAAIDNIKLGEFRQHRMHPEQPLFSQLPIDAELLAKVAALPQQPADKLESQLGVMAAVNEIVSEALRHFETTRAAEKKRTTPDVDSRLLVADQYLKSHLTDPPSVLSLANVVGLNHMTLKRGFRRQFDQTVYGRLRSWRMERARELLAAGASVTDASLQVGYSNPSKFAAAFRLETGKNPSEFSSS